VVGSFGSFFFNYTLNLGVSRATPLFFRLVTVATVPLSFALTAILAVTSDPESEAASASVTALRVSGALMICAGFVLFAVMAEREQRAFVLIAAQGQAQPPDNQQFTPAPPFLDSTAPAAPPDSKVEDRELLPAAASPSANNSQSRSTAEPEAWQKRAAARAAQNGSGEVEALQPELSAELPPVSHRNSIQDIA
jgi:hypothetical protein